MHIVKAVRAIKPIKNGCTLPYIVSCDDGNEYVTKFKENPEGLRVLANEYVCAKIADFLDLPLATPSLIDVDEEFIRLYNREIDVHLQAGIPISKGIHFGTKLIKKVFPITSSKMLEYAHNIQVIPEIILFDQLICNKDRDANKGNLIFDQGSMKVIMIDHTYAFDIGPLWDHTQLLRRIGEQFTSFFDQGCIFAKLVPHVQGNSPFDSIIAKMQRMTQDDLWHIINTIPDEWQVNVQEREALHTYLSDRLNRIKQALPVLKPKLPHWKGGC